MQQVEKDELQGPYLGEVEPHLFAVEVGLVESQSRLGCGQSVAETDPDPPERLEVLELHLRVERAEQAFETGLERQRERTSMKWWVKSGELDRLLLHLLQFHSI